MFINGTLSYFTMPEGRVLNNSGTLSQQFIITDQQGNARITFDNSGTGGTAKVLQENSYYAFGMVMAGSPVAAPAVPNKNLYNGGSEWQNDYTNQPDVYQTFNRNYDAAIGRFLGVDPEPEGAASMTNYQYSGNNPIMFNDPGGNKARQSQSESPDNDEFVQGAIDDFWQGVGLSLAFDYSNSLQYGGSYVGSNIGTGQNGQMTSALNGLNYDTHYNWDEITPAIAAALAFVGFGTSPSVQAGGGDTPSVGYTDPGTGGSSPMLAIAGPDFNAMFGANAGGWNNNYRQFQAIVAGEASNFDDATGIGSVILNRMAAKGVTFDNDNWLYSVSVHHKGRTVDQDIYSSYNAYGGANYKAVMNMSAVALAQSGYALRVAGANEAYDGYMEDFDYSKGAYIWNASSQQYSSHPGFNFNLVTKGVYTITGTLGGTTFMRYTDESKTWP